MFNEFGVSFKGELQIAVLLLLPSKPRLVVRSSSIRAHRIARSRLVDLRNDLFNRPVEPVWSLR